MLRAMYCGISGAWVRSRSGGEPAAYMAKNRVVSTSRYSILMFGNWSRTGFISSSVNSPVLRMTVTVPWIAAGATVGTAVGARVGAAVAAVVGALVAAGAAAGGCAHAGRTAPPASVA